MVEIAKWEHLVQLVLAALMGFFCGISIGWHVGWDEARRFFKPWGWQ